MNIIRYIYPIFLIVMLASCSADEIDPSGGEDRPESSVVRGNFYINFSLNPHESSLGTRASASTGSYDEIYGEYETKILNGRIYLYEEAASKKEEDAVCVTYGLLTAAQPEMDNTSIFLTKPVTFRNIKLEEFEYDPEKTYYALIVINANTWTLYPQDLATYAYKGPQTFGEWAKTPVANNMVIDSNDRTTYLRKYITMTNATGHAGGGTFEPKTLVKLDPDDISNTPFDDTHQPKTTIYVQRNVAKFTMKGNGLTGEKKLVTTGNFTLQVNLTHFFMDVVNSTTYPVMNIDGLDWTNSWSHTNNGVFDWVHWVKDPNYSDDTISLDDFERGSSEYQNNTAGALYCLENTFDPAHMLQGQTTRMVIRCRMVWNVSNGADNPDDLWPQINLPDDYKYPLGGDGSDKFDNYHNNLSLGFFIIGSGDASQIWDRMHIEETLQAAATAKGWVSLSFQWADLEGGYYTLSELLTVGCIDDDGSEGVRSLTVDEFNSLASELGLADVTDDKLTWYNNGFMYYVVRIRHYDDSETPWDGTTETKNGRLLAKYDDSHLGRYGVVRNNHYEVLVSKIAHFGTPDIPPITPDDTDDMPEEYYLEFKVSPVKWSVRQDSFDL